MKTIINIELENISLKEVKKLRNYFVRLTQAQIHRIKNGKLILHFDNKGDMRRVVIEKVMWDKHKS